MVLELNLEECEQVAVEIAKKAGKLVSDTCGTVSSIESKLSYADLVTETDKNVEELVFDLLKEKFPDHKYIGEESVAADNYGKVNLTDEPTWIVDPVDGRCNDLSHIGSQSIKQGTMNFVHTFPFVAVCIGLAIKKQPVMGIVYCPAMDKMYTARQGNGAYCNGSRLNVRRSNALKDSLVCAEVGSDRNESKRECVFENMQSVGWQCHGIRALGSAAMNICSVASGHTNAYYEYGLHCWDICAPAAILLEAGGYICDTTGEPLNLLGRRFIGACSEKVAQELSKALVIQLQLPSD